MRVVGYPGEQERVWNHGLSQYLVNSSLFPSVPFLCFLQAQIYVNANLSESPALPEIQELADSVLTQTFSGHITTNKCAVPGCFPAVILGSESLNSGIRRLGRMLMLPTAYLFFLASFIATDQSIARKEKTKFFFSNPGNLPCA